MCVCVREREREEKPKNVKCSTLFSIHSRGVTHAAVTMVLSMPLFVPGTLRVKIEH